jgi:hypothetical protein
MIEIIYLDMDGVLTDFTKRYIEMFECEPDKIAKKSWKPNWERFVGESNFQTLDWHPNGKELYLGVKQFANKNRIHLDILTSAGGEDMIESIAHQKRHWLKTNLIAHRYLHVVPGKRYKKDFAADNAVIIDDMESVIARFRENGGHAIHHLGDAKDTLNTLLTYAKF